MTLVCITANGNFFAARSINFEACSVYVYFSFVYANQLQLKPLQPDTSEWLKAGETQKCYRALGIPVNEFSTPASVPFIHSEYSFIFPFKAFPNNRPLFPVHPGSYPYGELQASDFLSLQELYSTTRGPGGDKCWRFAGASTAYGAWQSFCVRQSRCDPELWAVLMTGSITRTSERNALMWHAANPHH